MNAPALLFENVSKHFGRHRALAGVSLHVARGEAFGLVGCNGAGKTTLIKAMLDFCDVDSGRAEIFGVDHRDHRSRERLAYLPERFLPPFYLTGGDFLEQMAGLRGQRWSDADIGRTLQSLDLEAAALTRPVRQYSKGMAQKLGLAACLLASRDLLVLDEPTSGLDPKARALLKAALRARLAQGATLFFSSHALSDVDELCTRMGILHHGRVLFEGTAAECRRRFGAADLESAFLACVGSPLPGAAAGAPGPGE